VGIQFTVYPVARLVTYTVEGLPTDLEASDFIEAVLARRHFKRGFDFLGECQTTDEPGAAYHPALARAVRGSAVAVGPCQ
jgi:hypothetical protein